MITIRNGNLDDIQNICEMLIESWKNSYSSFIPIDYLNNLNVERQISRHTKNMIGATKYFIAENHKSKLIGFSSYGKNRVEKVNCEKELYTMYVRNKYQGNGIGTLLLNSVLHDLKDNNCTISVLVFEKNPYKEFYLKNGFVKIDNDIVDLGEFELEGEIYTRSI